MYALKVTINDEAPFVAGAEDLGVLNAIVSCVGVLGSQTRRARDEVDLSLTVGGLTSRAPELADEHVRWLPNRGLSVGDVVRIELVETTVADAPISGHEAEKRKHDEREYFEHCKRAYLKMREKYEGEGK